jgi:uncharacterized protein with beta-barrel porin domain
MTRRNRLALLALTAAFGLFVFNASSADAACLPDPPADDDNVSCTGTDSTGYDASGATGLTITVDPGAELSDADPGLDSAILLSDDNTVDIGAGAIVTVTEADGFGINGGDDNRITNGGTITINGTDGRGVSLGTSTGSLPISDVTNTSNALIQALADGSIAIEVGDDVAVQNRGTIEAAGNSTIGISALDRTQYNLNAFLSNTLTINVSGSNSVGIQAGDGWAGGVTANPGDPFVPNGAAIFHGDTVSGVPDTTTLINVTGDDSYGIFAGDNSFVASAGQMSVTGMNSIGISVGGNDLLQFGDSAVISVVSVQNIGTIVGGVDAGPLIEFRTFSTGENRFQNTDTGILAADLSGVALLGSGGTDVVVNQGRIDGSVQLGAGDDRYLHDPGATLNGSVDGGAGNDILRLNDNGGPTENFDLGLYSNFETLRIAGGNGWTLTNSAGFTGLTEILDNGVLQVPTPITLGGDFAIAPTGTLNVTLDGTTAPLTVMGASTFDGTLNLTATSAVVESPTPYRVIAANGGYTGVFGTLNLPNRFLRVFIPSYDANGLAVLVQFLPLATAARGDNQVSIANHLQQIDDDGGGSADLNTFINQLQTADNSISNAFVALSPEVYDAHTTVSFEGGRTVTNLLFDRPRECVAGEREHWSGLEQRLPCRPREWSPWMSAIGSFRSREKFAGHPRYDAQLGGIAAGIDYRPIENLDLTFAVASQRGTINVAGGGDSTITLVDVMAQGAWTHGPLRLQGALGWGHGFHKDRRRVYETATATPVDVRGVTDHDSNRISLAGEVGLAYDVGPIKVEPIAGIDWAWIDQGSIHEDEAGGFGIKIDSRDDNTGSMNAGVRLSTVYEHKRYIIQQLNWMDGVWRPELNLQWRQVLAGNNRDIQARLEGAPDAVPDFKIKGKEDNGGFEIGGGVSFIPKNANRLQFDLNYDAYVASHTVAQSLVGRILIGF